MAVGTAEFGCAVQHTGRGQIAGDGLINLLARLAVGRVERVVVGEMQTGFGVGDAPKAAFVGVVSDGLPIRIWQSLADGDIHHQPIADGACAAEQDGVQIGVATFCAVGAEGGEDARPCVLHVAPRALCAGDGGNNGRCSPMQIRHSPRHD